MATREFYRLKLGLFVRWCDEQGVTTLQQLTAHDLRRHLVSLSRRELSSQYQNNLARAIRAFLNCCVRDELLAVSPLLQMDALAVKADKPLPDQNRVIFAAVLDRLDPEMAANILQEIQVSIIFHW